MDKAPDAYRTISEVGEDLDIAQHVLRFWETRFPQIKPLKRGGGRRYYRPDDVELLKGIRHLLYREGYTIKGVQRILREQGLKDVMAVGRSGSIAALAPEPEVAEWTPAPVFNEPIFSEPVSSKPVFSEPTFERPAAAEPILVATPLPAHTPVLATAPVVSRPVPAPNNASPTKKPAPAESAMPLLDAMLPPQAVGSAEIAPIAAQVSMFRGGLQRGQDMPAPALPDALPPMESPSADPDRRARLRHALAELEACKAILAEHQRRAN